MTDAFNGQNQAQNMDLLGEDVVTPFEVPRGTGDHKVFGSEPSNFSTVSAMFSPFELQSQFDSIQLQTPGSSQVERTSNVQAEQNISPRDQELATNTVQQPTINSPRNGPLPSSSGTTSSPSSSPESPRTTAAEAKQVSASSENSQLIEFKAQKKGGNVKNWKTRYFVFDPSQGSLAYFADAQKATKKGQVDLRQCNGIGPVLHDRFPHTLGLRTKERLWVLAFESADLMGRIQTSLNSVVTSFVDVLEVPQSRLGKIKKSLLKKDKNGKTGTEANFKDSASSSKTNNGGGRDAEGLAVSDSASSGETRGYGTSSAATANEKAAISKLNDNLSKLKEYSGMEFTFECDMNIVKARLETDHPEKKDQPGDIIYGDFLSALASRFQEVCETQLYRDAINHKCNGRIKFRVSDDDGDKQKNEPLLQLDDGTLVIVCHRSLLTAPLFNLGSDLTDVLSVGESLHLSSVKDIDDHRQAIKSCLIKIQSSLNVTYQFECDYTEGFHTLKAYNPTMAEKWKLCWGEVVYRFLDAATQYLGNLSADFDTKLQLITDTPSRTIRITIEPTGAKSHWINTQGGVINVFIAASLITTDKIQF